MPQVPSDDAGNVNGFVHSHRFPGANTAVPTSNQDQAAISEIVRWRRAHQPGGSNAGSVFANPTGDSAGRLVEAAGLKGLRRGSARVSSKHANFIVVDGGGSAGDVRDLMETVRDEVARRTGVVLRTEVCLVGFGEDGGRARAATAQ
jgi:UDP-N-acetylenolpyruvoylglucosamine reductase